MKQPWIHNAKTDLLWVISPTFIILFILLIFENKLEEIQDNYSFITWLVIIVFIDVAHVYSTLFKTYFIKSEFNKHKLRYILIPVLSFIISLLLYQFGNILFWSVLALVAIFHFVRQQYGIMKIYAREESNNLSKQIDVFTIYVVTLFPVFYWFITPRKFNWFIENEFNWLFFLPNYLFFIQIVYYSTLVLWCLKVFFKLITYKSFNLPKNLFIVGTILSWYFSIVYFNNDFAFTLLNVVSHGVPYITIVYLKTIVQPNNIINFYTFLKPKNGIFLFIVIILGFAFIEEYFWEIFIWKEYFGSSFNLSNKLASILVPVLTIPQLSHYILDGFIWKSKHSNS